MMFIPNLTFNGDCREALTCYAYLFGGSLGEFLPWDADTITKIPEMNEDHVMNGSVTVEDFTLMGSDQFGDMYAPAGNMSLLIEMTDVADAQTKFDALAAAGQTYMPFGETFWADGYGFCMDRFGVQWQVSCRGSKAPP